MKVLIELIAVDEAKARVRILPIQEKM